MEIWKNGNQEKWKYGKIDILKMEIWIMEIWKNESLEKQKFGNMEMWKN